MPEPDATAAVLLLTQADCKLCTDAKALLERLALEYRLAITIEDLRSPTGQELASRGGLLFAPGIVINGEPFAYGRPSERMLRRRLERIGARR